MPGADALVLSFHELKSIDEPMWVHDLSRLCSSYFTNKTQLLFAKRTAWCCFGCLHASEASLQTSNFAKKKIVYSDDGNYIAKRKTLW